MNGLTQSVVTIIVGAAVARLAGTSAYLTYVKEGLRPFLLVSAAVLLIVGVATLVRELRANGGKHRRAAAPACAGHGDGDSHGHSGPRSAWLLLAPVLAVFLIAPPSLGSYAATRTGTATNVAKRDSAARDDGKSIYPPLPAEDPVRLTLLDYAARAVFDQGASLTGRKITLVGFIGPGQGGNKYLNRMIMICCAADSRPIKVGLKGKVTAKNDQWVQVTGVYITKQDTDPLNDEKIPYFQIKSVQKVDPPENQYDIAS